MTHEPLVILHAVPGAWLPATQTWLHDQVRLLPDPVVSHVVCDRVEHADRFRVPNVHAADADPPLLRLADGWRSRVRRGLGGGRHRDLVVRAARAAGADVLHSHFGPEGWRNAVAARRLGLTDDAPVKRRLAFLEERVLHETYLVRKVDEVLTEERLRAEFTALDTLISQLNVTSGYLAQQLASLPQVGNSNS